MSSKLKPYLAFAVLSFAWGSSFYWIKIALQEVGPLTLVAFRVLFGFLGLVIALATILRPQSLPRNPRTIAHIAFHSVISVAIPFSLLSWGENYIDSGLTGVLNGTMPLFTLVLAHLTLADEKMTLSKILGLLAGFCGVVILVGRNHGASLGLNRLQVKGALAVLGASFFYALGAVYTRRFIRNQNPYVQATLLLLTSTLVQWPAAALLEQPFAIPHQPLTWMALVWLGLIGSCTAYILYFFLMNAWGATRSALVMYVSPVVGVVLGVLLLHETVDVRLIVGTTLVLGGVALTNLKNLTKRNH